MIKRNQQCIKLYDFTEGGTDIIDQRMGNILQKRKVENGQG